MSLAPNDMTLYGPKYNPYFKTLTMSSSEIKAPVHAPRIQMAPTPLREAPNDMMSFLDQDAVTQRKEKFQGFPVPIHSLQPPNTTVGNQEVLQVNCLSDIPTGNPSEYRHASSRDSFPTHYCRAGADTHVFSQMAFGASYPYKSPGSYYPNTGLGPSQEPKRIGTTAYSVTSSDTLSDDCSPIKTASQSSTQDAVCLTKCPRCRTTFQGAPANQKRNLRRHMSDKHSIDLRLPCPVPTCGQSFGYGRYDNQKRHLMNKHGL